MIRTQIYLTSQENKMLGLLAHMEGRTKSEIIRRVLDEKLHLGSPGQAASSAERALGAWKGSSGKKLLADIRRHW